LGEKVLRQAQHDNSQGLGEDAKSNEKMKAYCFGKLSMTVKEHWLTRKRLSLTEKKVVMKRLDRLIMTTTKERRITQNQEGSEEILWQAQDDNNPWANSR